MKKYCHARFKLLIVFLLSIWLNVGGYSQNNSANEPVRLAVAGLKHGHAPFIFDRKDRSAVIVVGIYEPDQELAERYAKKYQLDKSLFYIDLNKMLDAVK